MTALLFTNARLVNEGETRDTDVLVKNGRIEHIDGQITAPDNARVIDAAGRHLLPGMIDAHVHCREPGLTHKGEIATESAAAVAGGTTAYMEMPNVKPPTTDAAALDVKRGIASQRSVANYAFYLGATNDNIEAIRAVDPLTTPGIKVFMGASTGNMLVNDDTALHAIFEAARVPVLTHCEDTPMIQANEAAARAKYGEDVPFAEHANIRSTEACYQSSARAVELAREHGTHLHLVHVSTARELDLFQAGPVAGKRITAEACTHHLWFDDSDYADKGALIKCNPAIKTAADREALLAAVVDGRLDTIGTDHAPHTWDEKQNSYFSAPSGLPLIQHALISVLEHVHRGVFSLEMAVHKTSHAVADVFNIAERGYVREGYWADLVLVDLDTPTAVADQRLYSKCGWSPFAGTTFASRIDTTVVCGQLAWHDGHLDRDCRGQALAFLR